MIWPCPLANWHGTISFIMSYVSFYFNGFLKSLSWREPPVQYGILCDVLVSGGGYYNHRKK